jgi:hypothetical protein
MSNEITVTFELPENEAMALAQFAKRVCWSEFRMNAENDEQAYLISGGIAKLQKGLAEAGFAPR